MPFLSSLIPPPLRSMAWHPRESTRPLAQLTRPPSSLCTLPATSIKNSEHKKKTIKRKWHRWTKYLFPILQTPGGDLYFNVELLFLLSEMTWNKVINNNIYFLSLSFFWGGSIKILHFWGKNTSRMTLISHKQLKLPFVSDTNINEMFWCPQFKTYFFHLSKNHLIGKVCVVTFDTASHWWSVY